MMRKLYLELASRVTAQSVCADRAVSGPREDSRWLTSRASYALRSVPRSERDGGRRRRGANHNARWLRREDFPVQDVAATGTARDVDTQRQHPLDGGPGRRRLVHGNRRRAQQFPTTGQSLLLVSTGQQAVMADSHETIRQHVLQKAPKELVGWQPHRLAAGALTAVATRERDFTGVATQHPP